MLDVTSCRGASSDSDHYLVRGKYRCKIAYKKYEPNGTTTRRFYIDALREASTVRRCQQQLEEEFGKLKTEQVTEGESHIGKDWKQLKEAIK